MFLPLSSRGFTRPQDGYVGPMQSLTGWAGHMILPWITLATVSAAVYSRLSRSSLGGTADTAATRGHLAISGPS